LLPGLIRLDIHRHCAPEDQDYFRRSREERFGATLEEVVHDRQARLPAFRTSLDPLRRTVERQDFISGKTPAYADYIIFGAFQWAGAISDFEVLAADDPVRIWRGRMLDLFDGLARRAPRSTPKKRPSPIGSAGYGQCQSICSPAVFIRGCICQRGNMLASSTIGSKVLRDVCVSARVQEDAAGKLDLVFEDLGEPSSSRTVTSLAAASMSRHASKDWRSQSTSSDSRTEVRATLRWREMDSNFQYASTAMAPSHGFAAISHREAALRGAPASHGETAFRGAAGFREAPAAMRSTHREMRCSASLRDSRRRSFILDELGLPALCSDRQPAAVSSNQPTLRAHLPSSTPPIWPLAVGPTKRAWFRPGFARGRAPSTGVI
jgi:hypothetical protein